MLMLRVINIGKLVLFPDTDLLFEVSDREIIEFFEITDKKQELFFISSEDTKNQIVSKVGVIAEVKTIDKLSDGSAVITLYGRDRAKIRHLLIEKNIFHANVSILNDYEDIEIDIDEEIEVLSKARTGFKTYAETIDIPKNIYDFMITFSTLSTISYYIASILRCSFEEKQLVLEDLDPMNRAKNCILLIEKEIESIKTSQEIDLKVKKERALTSRENLLRDRIEIMRRELGEEDAEDEFEKKILLLAEKLGDDSKTIIKLRRELRKLRRSHSHNSDSDLTREYLEIVLDLPWGDKSDENDNFKKAEEILEKEHYGLIKVKERILEFLAVRYKSESKNSPILCLVGPPGVGKTSIARSIANALGREYVRISLGGVQDEAELRGHRKTYIGSMPGRIIYALRSSKKDNPLILLDEVDKMSQNAHRGDATSALLEILDKEQNKEFRDTYIEIDYDISDCLFICTANSVDQIQAPLKDRLEIINLSTYTLEEKREIAIRYLIPKQIEKNVTNLNIESEAIEEIITFYTKEAGVRGLERNIEALFRKVVKKELSTGEKVELIKKDDLQEYLGAKRFKNKKLIDSPEVGVVRGLAYTALGGETLSIEATKVPGKGTFKLTGNVGKVMSESMATAYSLVRSKSKELGIDENIYPQIEVHIHIPEGATPKDGPSAGAAMTTAIASALSGKLVDNKVAMTGEITLRGKVLPIGGLKEKILAAKSIGVQKILIPEANEGDLFEIEDYIKEGIDFVLVKDISEVFSNVFV